MGKEETSEPDSTAARVALWRALHVQDDPPPHVLEDEIGLKLLAPVEGWKNRPDMDLRATSSFRASIVARARFIEDLVMEQMDRGVGQYVLLGAGLDSFAQRQPEIGSGLTVFEVDRPGSQAWKQRRLAELGFALPAWLRFVPANFDADGAWWDSLVAGGFDTHRPAIVASAGVSMYLTTEAIRATLHRMAGLAPGSTFAMTFLLPLRLADPEIRPWLELAEKGAQASGTPFVSYFTPEEMLALGREAGFRDVRHVSASDLAERYFAGRRDGLRPPRNTEEFLIAST